MTPVDAVVEPARSQMSGAMRAAILLVTLGEEASAAIIQEFTDDELRAVTHAIAALKLVSPEQSTAVLNEFYEATVARSIAQRGGPDYARRMLNAAFGDDAPRRASELKLELPEEAPAGPFQRTNPQQLAMLIRNEHPQTVAIILAHLPPEQAAQLLVTLPREQRKDVAIRVANIDQVSPAVVRRIVDVLARKIEMVGSVSGASVGGVRSVAGILNLLQSSEAEDILEDIRYEREGLEESIRRNMFLFEDLLGVDQKSMREIVAKIDRKLLVVGLKGTSEELRAHILGSMSQRGAEMLKEDMEAAGPAKIRDVEAAQQQIIAVVRALQAEGVISVGKGGDDQYVE